MDAMRNAGCRMDDGTVAAVGMIAQGREIGAKPIRVESQEPNELGHT